MAAVTHRQIVQLSRLFDKHQKIKEVKLAYALARNKLKIKPILTSLEDSNTPSEAYNAYDKARLELCNSMAVKLESGRPKMQRSIVMSPLGPREVDTYVFEDPQAAMAAIEELRNRPEHKEALEEHAKKDADFLKLLDESIDVDFYGIPVESVPDGLFTLEDILLLTETQILREPPVR